ncbi:MAG: sugar phosphate isomerase/epimerase [Acidobacteriota bacterium]|nr:sugar phosphate isomerase/epimerase [Acidobacteriota bacterium]
MPCPDYLTGKVEEFTAARPPCAHKIAIRTIIARPLYSPVGLLPRWRRNANGWNCAVDCYPAIGPVLAGHDVTIAIEPLDRFEIYLLNTAEEAVRLYGEIDHPNVGILFDTFHANIEVKILQGLTRTVGKHFNHVHTCENDRGIPGTGQEPRRRVGGRPTAVFEWKTFEWKTWRLAMQR